MKIIKPDTARQAEGRASTEKAKPLASVETDANTKPKPSSALDAAKRMARDEYGVEARTKKPMTAAQRRAKRRREYVAVSVELPAATAAKLIALAEHQQTTKTAVIRNLINAAEINAHKEA